MVRPNVRAALDYLDQILSRDGEDAMELWDVLTALRGPDEHSSSAKSGITIPIRRAALPLTACAVERERSGSGLGLDGVHRRAGFGTPQYDVYRGDTDCYGRHFTVHGYRAAVALGLTKRSGD